MIRIGEGGDGEDIIAEYLRDSPRAREDGMSRISELMERCHVSKRGAQVMIDHDQEGFE